MSYYIQKGTKAFRNTTLALFFGAFNTFAIMYSTQPLLPEFSRDFNVAPANASLSLSLTTITLAISMLFVGSLSEVKGRKPIMILSLALGSVVALLTALAPNFKILLALRVIQGIALSGLPAVAMAYLSEEVEPSSLGIAMGLYISGNSIGGTFGRVMMGTVTDFFDWRIALGTVGVISIIASLFFWKLLPPSRNFQPRPFEVKTLLKSMGDHLKDPGLLCLYGIAFLAVGSFVCLFNYIGYQLAAPPYSLSQSVVGGIFLIYIVGTFSSTLMGRLADQYGRRRVIWISLIIMVAGALTTLSMSLALKILGIAMITFGFFGTYSIASSWVGRRATHDKAQASSLYLFSFYTGSSVGGTLGGVFWSVFGWAGVVGMICCFLCVAFFLSFCLQSIAPIQRGETVCSKS